MARAHQFARGCAQIGLVHKGMARKDCFVAAIIDETANGVIDTDRFKHPDAALEPCVVALWTANGLVDRCPLVKAQQRRRVTIGLNRFAAAWA